MQPCQIMSQPGVLPLDTGHIGLADNLVTVWNELWIDRIAISNIEKALPQPHQLPQGFKGCSAAVTDSPA